MKEIYNQATAKYQKIITLRAEIPSGKLKKISKSSHASIGIDFDQECGSFEEMLSFHEDSSISSCPLISPISSSPDWFDPDAFPPLPSLSDNNSVVYFLAITSSTFARSVNMFRLKKFLSILFPHL